MSTTKALENTEFAATVSLTIAPPPEEKVAAPGLCDAAVAAPVADEVILHVRFHPDARVWDIAECPNALDKEQWFKVLCARFGSKYQTRAGGRGFFRISRIELESAKAFRPH
ncbi:hypothetical protein [Methylocystis bryophila]|uniref:hypothetical protein n=1 Tax=Methylocystis bryophila TaxID=655015 RepID=UPI001FDA4FBB|nr:hypothetical protein [Methylocystis bryophila]BDV40204.1 hypothetical protein DSM21852_34570 [Methylocystis bryophila]